MRNSREMIKVVLFLFFLGGIGALHFGCDDPVDSGTDNCGKGPFQRDEKSGVCKSLATGSPVDSNCCP